jgi:probable non-F420 flavinoid oxidoreductase
MPITIGFHCSHEQHPPSTLLALLRRAEQVGFTAAMCSDHFHPWSGRQGHAGFTWSWLGAALATTRLSLGTVCAPGQRYHPAIIAQAAATLAEMFPDRFWLAVGSGEALNESITGDPWPDKPQRHERLEAAATVMRALWNGVRVTHHGAVRVRSAELYDRPIRPPLLVGAALTPETARWMGGWADALITVAADRDHMRRVADAFREGGGAGKPLFLQVVLAFADSDDRALSEAHDQWRQCALPREQLAELDSPDAFDRAAAGVTMQAVAARVRVSSEIGRQIDWLRDDVGLGFSRLYLHNVVRDHDRFFDACAERLLPELEGLEVRS